MARAKLCQLGGGRLPAHEINHGNLLDREGHVLPAIDAEVEVTVNQVLVLIAVEDDGAALPLAIGEDERGPLRGRQRVNAGARHERDGRNNATKHQVLLFVLRSTPTSEQGRDRLSVLNSTETGWR